MAISRAMLADTWKRLPPDARQTVTYFSKSQEKFSPTGQDVPNAHKKPLHKDVVGSDEQLATYEVVWDLWKSQMTAVTWGSSAVQEPKKADKLVDAAGIGYIVMKVDVMDLGERYELTCQQSQKSR